MDPLYDKSMYAFLHAYALTFLATLNHLHVQSMMFLPIRW